MAATELTNDLIFDGTIEDADISATAGIQLTKLEKTVIAADGTNAMAADLDLGSNKITNLAAGTNANDAVNKGQLDAAISGLDIQADVLGVQQDANLDPGASPTAGDRYVITDSLSLHANFGTITGLSDNDIVIYDGTSFVVIYPVSAYGSGALVWDRGSGTWQSYDGSSWNEFGGLAGVTAGSGLSKTGHTINVGAATNGGIQVNADDIGILLDGATLSLGASGLSISGEGVGTAQLAGTSVTAAKLGSDVAGLGLTQAVGGELDVNVGDGIAINTDTVEVDLAGTSGLEFSSAQLKAKVDDTTIEINGSNELAVKPAGTNGGFPMTIGGAVTYVKRVRELISTASFSGLSSGDTYTLSGAATALLPATELSFYYSGVKMYAGATEDYEVTSSDTEITLRRNVTNNKNVILEYLVAA